MDVYPKFIIETDEQVGDCLIIAKCTYHNQIATDITKVKGGGWWIKSSDNTTFTLYGESHEFGRARIENIANCVHRKKVFSNPSLIINIANNFNFQYRDEVGNIINLENYNKK